MSHSADPTMLLFVVLLGHMLNYVLIFQLLVTLLQFTFYFIIKLFFWEKFAADCD